MLVNNSTPLVVTFFGASLLNSLFIGNKIDNKEINRPAERGRGCGIRTEVKAGQGSADERGEHGGEQLPENECSMTNASSCNLYRLRKQAQLRWVILRECQ